MKKTLTPLLAALSMLLPALASAQVPGGLAYQGRLLKADGSPETGVQKLTFKLFDAATGGTALWSEDQDVVLTDGFYAVVLGDVTALPATTFDGAEKFLELSTSGGPMSPRQRVVSVPYAVTARNLSGGTVNASSISVGGKTVVDAAGTVTANALSVGGKTVIDTTGAVQGVYTKTESDAKYELAGACYSKTEADTKFAPQATTYTKTEVDSLISTKSLPSGGMLLAADAQEPTLIAAGYSNVGASRAESYLVRNVLPVAAGRVSVAPVIGTRLWAVGGHTAAASECARNIQEFDLISGTWSARTNLVNGRNGQATFAWTFADGTNGVFAIGGACGAATTATNHRADTEMFDPDLNTVVAKAPIPGSTIVSHYGGAYGLLSDNKFHIVTGSATTARTLQHDVYDPETNTWTTAAPFPSGTSNGVWFPAFGVLPDGRLIVAGGRTSLGNATPRTETYIYDPKANTWTLKAAMPAALSSASGAVIAGKFHTFLGQTFNAGTGTMVATTVHYIYDPVTNKWSTGLAVPYTNFWPYVAQLPGSALIVGGGTPVTTAYEYLAPLYLFGKL